MRIRMRIRKISMRTPYSTFPYPSSVSACVFPYYKQCLHIIVISHLKTQYILSKIWWTVFFFIIYTCHIARIRCVRGRLWIWYTLYKRENHCNFANLTQDNNLNKKTIFDYIEMYKHFGNIGGKLLFKSI